jgi:hypothetical protein
MGPSGRPLPVSSYACATIRRGDWSTECQVLAGSALSATTSPIAVTDIDPSKRP